MSNDRISDPSSPLILVDGSSYLFRAYHSPPHLTNSRGEATGAIYGVINMLKSLVRQYSPEQMIVIFDAKGPTFRNEMYSEYKANRPPMPDDLRTQIAPLHKIIEAMGLPITAIEGVEADDVIGTIADQQSKLGNKVLISTGDKDMAQLVNEHVTLINTMTNTILNPEGVETKFGVKPEQIIDYLALMGDKSDNIPGVPGVGEKTAVGLIQGLGSIDNIYQNLDDVAGLGFRGSKTMKAKLVDNQDQLKLSYQLATIKLDVDHGITSDKMFIQSPDKEKLAELYKECEFKRWLAEVLAGNSNSEPPLVGSTTKPANTSIDDQDEDSSIDAVSINKDLYQTIFTLEQWQSILAEINNAKLIAFDTETTSIDYMDAELVGFSIAYELNDDIKAIYVPLAHDYEDAPEQISLEQITPSLKALLEDKNISKVGQNLKYDINVLAKYNLTIKGVVGDTMLQSYVFNSTATKHNMDALALKYLGHNCISFEDVAGKGAKQITFNQISIETAAPYAAEDADITLRLYKYFDEKLQNIAPLNELMKNIELPLMPILSHIEHNGVLIDADQMHALSSEFSIKLQELELKAHEIAGEEFNLASPKQLQVILFEKLELPIVKKTPKGAPSTAEEVLLELSHDYDLPKVIMEFRGLSKLKSTYTDKLPLMIKPATGRVHTSYHQAIAATGRLSSTDPNLQNIPIRNANGRRIREAFVAPQGTKIVAIDYSQIELRIMAHLSDDKGLLTAFANNLDIHKKTASEVFSTPFEEVTKEQRRAAKAVNFGLIYGMSAFGLARQLDIKRGEAQSYIDKYFERFPGVLTYMETTRVNAEKQGYVETLFGRRLYLPDITARNVPRRKAAERAAINAPMQGTAADIIKMAMINVYQWLTSNDIQGVKIVMQVHDELVFEIDENLVDEYLPILTDLMESAASLKVPLIADSGTGDNWDQAH
ncbi:DNA polymerase I [Psychrosphaera saromensis]|uniref:DNA polymerase I n=1 Tax=Psychrosphaera saromensis TaxID=716813 RepID=A0A2S7UTE0_9GAMM|nr:DNA polymerase I [Psychrosphaera saromensis]PQJ53005.1 DNA polymerase I [Psychrosphaera saromensis]GHB77299.1 DNA polymerase I [Psychrosphaera saromensis]GLQ12831.1 DNA polymerase I [Psychrosphaera saromensis]